MDPHSSYLLSTGQIFTLFFVMLGPLRLLGPFLEETRSIPSDHRTKLALQTGGIAFLAIGVGSILGEGLLKNWRIEISVLLLAGGLIFFAFAFQQILGIKFSHSAPSNASLTPGDLALRQVITPYGVVGVIVLLSSSHDLGRYLTVLGCLTMVMLLNILCMTYGYAILKMTGQLPLKILSNVLGSLQLALALQMILEAIRAIRIGT